MKNTAPLMAECIARKSFSISVGVALERPLRLHTDVVGLLLCECGHLGTQGREVQTSNLLVQNLGEQVDVVLVALLLGLQKVELSQDLIREGTRHDERGMAGGTTQVEETSGCEHNDAMPIGEHEAVNLWLNVLY